MTDVIRIQTADNELSLRDIAESLPDTSIIMTRAARFEQAFDEATRIANLLHAESGYPYIQWSLPGDPPVGLTLSPVEPGRLEQPI